MTLLLLMTTILSALFNVADAIKEKSKQLNIDMAVKDIILFTIITYIFGKLKNLFII
jgi:hypothetical protein